MTDTKYIYIFAQEQILRYNNITIELYMYNVLWK